MQEKQRPRERQGKQRFSFVRFGVVLLVALALGGCGALSYKSVMSKNSPAAYREFLFNNPDHPQAKEIRKLLDNADFQATKRIHTASAYRRYLEQHPSGHHVRRATYWAERLSYYDALSQTNPQQFKDFLKRFPRGEYASAAQERLQRTEYARAKVKNTFAAYSKFLARYKKYRTEWTAAATQRLERLRLDVAVAYNDPIALSGFIRDHPQSPYRNEAQKALKKVFFERLFVSNDVSAMEEFIRRYKGSKEVAVVSRRMEEVMLRTAEQTGRAQDLGRFLKRFPNSSYKERVAAALSLMARKRNRQLHRWVKLKNGEIEIFRPRRCRRCKPVMKVHATVSNKDTDFAFDLVLQSVLKSRGGTCCSATYRVNKLRPGEARQISFKIPGKVLSGPPPPFEIRILEGRAYLPTSKVKIPQPGGSGEKLPRDRFAPKPVPSLDR